MTEQTLRDYLSATVPARCETREILRKETKENFWLHGLPFSADKSRLSKEIIAYYQKRGFELRNGPFDINLRSPESELGISLSVNEVVGKALVTVNDCSPREIDYIGGVGDPTDGQW